jgi:hypothetical protein
VTRSHSRSRISSGACAAVDQHTAHSTQHTAHSTQHTAHSTQHTAHSTQHTAHSTHTQHMATHRRGECDFQCGVRCFSFATASSSREYPYCAAINMSQHACGATVTPLTSYYRVCAAVHTQGTTPRKAEDIRQQRVTAAAAAAAAAGTAAAQGRTSLQGRGRATYSQTVHCNIQCCIPTLVNRTSAALPIQPATALGPTTPPGSS